LEKEFKGFDFIDRYDLKRRIRWIRKNNLNGDLRISLNQEPSQIPGMVQHWCRQTGIVPATGRKFFNMRMPIILSGIRKNSRNHEHIRKTGVSTTSKDISTDFYAKNTL